MNATTLSGEDLVARVRERYGKLAAEHFPQGTCCDPYTPERALAENLGYAPEDLNAVLETANLGLGCGAPLGFLALQPGETVVDLGSGAGLDAFLAARQVGPTGRVIGIDMTPEMIARARAGASEQGFDNVEFREGRLEALPLDDASVDAITSNCVINLVPDKGAVFREIARVLKPGGRLVVSDIVLDGELPAPYANDLLAYVGCVAGALQRTAYFDLLRDAAGLGGIEVLRDVDAGSEYLKMSPEAMDLLDKYRLKPDAIRGIVRSVTYRARKALSTNAR